ncbi:MAG: hypothetical protein IPN79_09135 [Saprospiraceae bacterium]|nr:hypothetical protein [Saprospiraceae bacterium]
MSGLHRVIIIATATLLLFSQCRKEDNFIFKGQFESRFVIPSGLNTVLTHYIILENVYTDFSRLSNNIGMNVEDIKSIQASYGRMLTLQGGQDLDFIQDISITAISRKDRKLKKEMYYSEFVPFVVDEEIKMQSGTAELKEILSEDYIDIEIRLTIRNFVPNAIEATLDMSYIVF